MLTDPKLIKFLNRAIKALEADRNNKKLSTMDVAFMSGKIEAFEEIRDYGIKRFNRKTK